MESLGPKFTILSKDEYDKIFDEIKRIPPDCPPEQIVKKVHDATQIEISFMREWEYSLLTQFTFYRVRPVFQPLDNDLRENPQEYSYGPLGYPGRFNNINQQVFYSSGDPHTAIHELSKKIIPKETTVYLSKWGLRDCGLQIFVHYLFFGESFGKDTYSAILAQGIPERFLEITAHLSREEKENLSYCLELYQKLFTHNNDAYFHITSAIGQNLFTYSIKPANISSNIETPVISYPSVAKNRTAPNFAFRKDFADKALYIKEVDEIIVTELSDEVVRYMPKRRGIMNNGKMEWFDFQIRFDKANCEEAQISYASQPEVFQSINLSEKKLTLGDGKEVDFKSYLELNGITPKSFIAELQNLQSKGSLQINIPELHMAHRLKVEHSLKISKPLYVYGNVTNEAEIRSIKLPATYSIGFGKAVSAA